MKKNKSRKLFLLGIVIYILSFMLPVNLFESYSPIRPIGLTTIFICPLVGSIGLILGLKEKDKLFIALNALLIFIFPLTMFVGYLLGS